MLPKLIPPRISVSLFVLLLLATAIHEGRPFKAILRFCMFPTEHVPNENRLFLEVGDYFHRLRFHFHSLTGLVRRLS